jgi:hypothetical protein
MCLYVCTSIDERTPDEPSDTDSADQTVVSTDAGTPSVYVCMCVRESLLIKCDHPYANTHTPQTRALWTLATVWPSPYRSATPWMVIWMHAVSVYVLCLCLRSCVPCGNDYFTLERALTNVRVVALSSSGLNIVSDQDMLIDRLEDVAIINAEAIVEVKSAIAHMHACVGVCVRVCLHAHEMYI